MRMDKAAKVMHGSFGAFVSYLMQMRKPSQLSTPETKRRFSPTRHT
jgi:hypothetical protein